ncbi:hypothetical protein [Microbacterium sp.]|uniref:hypothetical protein n=1 Tax=Microbacterium sp. TaxID=51671 RepID=UPI002736C530|nr:hypothetical protein [Microbacterium sp.]MDP3952985.1 hypothetical protein [Microbacterium sp.]
MTSSTTRDRALQRDVRAWQKFTGVSYTTALRELEGPLVQGILGDRVSARDLIRVLEEHPVIGNDGDVGPLDDRGIDADAPMAFATKTNLFLEVALSIEVLRMFPLVAGTLDQDDWSSSYTLKHTAEHFLEAACGYVSNGSMIWAAAYLGLPISPTGDRNVDIPVPPLEHHYVRRMHEWGEERPKGHLHRPRGYTRLRSAIDAILNADARPEIAKLGQVEVSPFHEWLLQQKARGGPMGKVAEDYGRGIADSDHGFAADPKELMHILSEVGAHPDYTEAAEELCAEWESQRASD